MKVKDEVPDFVWGGMYEVLDAVSLGATLKPYVQCVVVKGKVILNVLKVTVTG